MNKKELKEIWLAEEACAHIHGWDFSHINDRYTEETDLPWNYEQIVRSYLKREHKLLDIDTGGGEFLLSLGHPYENTGATEGYPPNVKLCGETLTPLGIDFREMRQYDKMPFADDRFDIIINRHGNYDVSELYRTLKSNGIFITEQVGSLNDRELVELLLLDCSLPPFPDATLGIQSRLFEKAGFKILKGEETFRPIKFFDVGALVWFARIIEWEFSDFSVEKHFDNLLEAQKILERNGSVDGTIHRYLIIAQKP